MKNFLRENQITISNIILDYRNEFTKCLYFIISKAFSVFSKDLESQYNSVSEISFYFSEIAVWIAKMEFQIWSQVPSQFPPLLDFGGSVLGPW